MGKVPQSSRKPLQEHNHDYDQAGPCTMINAFLVFNGQGQPRLTKFYTQLVSGRARTKTGNAASAYSMLTA